MSHNELSAITLWLWLYDGSECRWHYHYFDDFIPHVAEFSYFNIGHQIGISYPSPISTQSILVTSCFFLKGGTIRCQKVMQQVYSNSCIATRLPLLMLISVLPNKK